MIPERHPNAPIQEPHSSGIGPNTKTQAHKRAKGNGKGPNPDMLRSHDKSIFETSRTMDSPYGQSALLILRCAILLFRGQNLGKWGARGRRGGDGMDLRSFRGGYGFGSRHTAKGGAQRNSPRQFPDGNSDRDQRDDTNQFRAGTSALIVYQATT